VNKRYFGAPSTDKNTQLKYSTVSPKAETVSGKWARAEIGGGWLRLELLRINKL